MVAEEIENGDSGTRSDCELEFTYICNYDRKLLVTLFLSLL
ncbi:hypothetical protein LINPERPRIM_LOCUS11197 [Linum perenne]